MKVCTKCKVALDLASFSSNKEAKDGKHSWCRPCVNKQRKDNAEKYKVARQDWQFNNADKIKLREKIRRADPSFKAKKSRWDKKYREKHCKELSDRKRAYYSDKQHLRRAEYQRNKQGYIVRAYERLHKIKCLTPPDADRKAIQAIYDEARALTLKTGIKYEVDHIVPVSKGGLHHQDNLQILVWTENRSKGAKVMEMRK